jgi:NTE family protein
VLSDGGVYDNLGLETVKRLSTLFVSDAGQKIAPEESPDHDWPRHALRVLDTIDNQVRSLRKRHLIDSYKRGDRTGAFWGLCLRPKCWPICRQPHDRVGALRKPDARSGR